MKLDLDEDSFLTAYLDGELEPDERLRVERALLSDPRVSEGVRDLAAVRDLISGLAEPATPRDVSASVLAAIRRRREAGPLGRVIGVTASSWSARAVSLVSAAAALIAMASVSAPTGGPHGPDPAAASRPDAFRTRAPGGVPQAAGPAQVLVADGRGTPAPVSRTSTPDAALALRDREQRLARTLLERPDLRKVLIVTDVVGGDARQQVGDLIEKTPRRAPAYGRFTVSQGIIVDPKHPGDATVFAVVMDAQELNSLRAKLNEAFPAAVEEVAPRPEVVTELTEVGQVSVFPGTAVADVFVPAEGPRRASMAGPKPENDLTRFESVFSVFDPPQAPDPDGPFHDPEPTKGAPYPARGGRGATAGPGRDRAPLAPADGSVVLVWVAAPRRPEVP